MERVPGMDANSSDGLLVLAGNRTGGGDPETNSGTLVLNVFTITLMSLATVIVFITAIVCTRAWHKHSRQYRRAREYEASVKISSSSAPITMSSMRRLINIHKSIILMRKQEKHNPQVYFIYSNLAMASEDQEKPLENKTPPVIPGDAKSSGVILNPCVFYV